MFAYKIRAGVSIKSVSRAVEFAIDRDYKDGDKNPCCAKNQCGPGYLVVSSPVCKPQICRQHAAFCEVYADQVEDVAYWYQL